LAKKGEGAILQPRRKIAHPGKIVKETIALENADDRLLLIGVTNDRAIPGVKYSEEWPLTKKQ